MTAARQTDPIRRPCEKPGLAKRALAFALAGTLALGALASPPASTDAFAAARGTDVVGGAVASSRGLNMTNAPSIEANYAYVVDSNGLVYLERDADAKTHIASITKIMTAVVALEHASLDDVVTVSATAASVGESSANLKAGDTLKLSDALKGLMVPSGNDAAIAIAETVGAPILEEAQKSGEALYNPDGSTVVPSDDEAPLQAFVAKMNEKAAELGCENTVFANPHGLDIGQFATEMHSTARDVATFSAAAMENEFFRSIVELPKASLDVERGGAAVKVEVESTDWLIGSYEGACGIKTGFTEQAGACFSGACNRDGIYLYAVVLDSPSENQRFVDARALFDWVYGSDTDYALANTDVFFEETPVVADVALADWNGRTVKATFADPGATVEVSSIFGNVSQDFQIEPVSGPVEPGDVVGRADFYQHNDLVASVDLVACEAAPAPSVFESLGIAWERLLASLSGEDAVAQSVIYNQTPLLLEKN